LPRITPLSDPPVFVVFTNRNSRGEKVRPSNWPERLADIVAAHSQKGTPLPRCGPCYYCADRYCFTIEQNLLHTEPNMASDMLFLLRAIDAQQLSNGCPKFRLLQGLGMIHPTAATLGRELRIASNYEQETVDPRPLTG